MGSERVPRSVLGTKKKWERDYWRRCLSFSPTQDTKHKVEDEEGPKDDETHEI